MKFKLVILFSTFYFLLSGFLFAAEFPTPTIAVNPDVYYPLDEVLYLEGRAKPNSTIQLHFQKQGAKPIRVNTKSDQNGEWVLAERVPLEAGEWEVRARVLDNSGATSDFSNPRLIKAIVTGIVIGGLTLKFSILVFLLLLVISASIATIVYFLLRVKKLKNQADAARFKDFKRELSEKTEALEKIILEKGKEAAKSIVEESFSDLKKKVVEELSHIEEAVGGPLDDSEKQHWNNLLRELKEAEEKIESRVKSIDHDNV